MILSWNRGAERMYGHSAEEIIGRDVSVLIPQERKAEERLILDRLRRGRKVEPYETERIRADGVRIDVALTVSPIIDPDRGPVGGAIVARDITTAKRHRQTQEFLARAGGALDASLDPVETMRTIASTAVPDLCELCVIDLLEEDGSFGAAVAAATDPALAEELEGIRRRSPLAPDGRHPVAQVMRARKPMVWRDLTEPGVISEVSQSDEHRELVERAGYRSAVVAPLTARGRTLGSLSLLHLASNRRYEAGDLALVEDLATRAAMALDNARLYADRAHIAAVLQRGLVPDQPPAIPCFQSAVAFEPAGAGIEVGGDFFDVVTRGEGSLVVVGDVAGRGSEAVALTSLVRHSVRAFALETDEPSEILRKVNDVMLGKQMGTDDPRFVTAILVHLEHSRENARLTVCSAGHPPALRVRSDGAIEALGGGSLLGIFRDIELNDRVVTLEPGDTVILYTDGLLEAGPVAEHLSMEELTGLVSGLVDLPPHEIASALRDDAFARAGSKFADDLLVLALRYTGRGEEALGSDATARVTVPDR